MKRFGAHVDPTAGISFEPAAPHKEEHDDDEEEEVDVVAVMNEMGVPERRNVYALKGLFEELKKKRAELREKVAQAQLRHYSAVQKLQDIRAELVRGVRDITEEEAARVPPVVVAPETQKKEKRVGVRAPEDEAAIEVLQAAGSAGGKGIPDFWLTALCNHEAVEPKITERDRAALRHLEDIRTEFVDGHPDKGTILHFHFSENEYFSNKVLSKTYTMKYNSDDDDLEVENVEGTEIDWASPKRNLTVVVKQKKQRNKNSKEIRVIEREEKCPSFFHFFSPPQDDDNEDLEEEEAELREEEMEEDIEIGQALKEDVVPKGVYYYAGKSVDDVALMLQKSFGFAMGNGDEDEDEEDDDDDDDEDDDDETEGKPGNFRKLVQQSGRGGGGAGRGRGGNGAVQPDCKQQ